jgi:hypothetical protein
LVCNLTAVAGNTTGALGGSVSVLSGAGRDGSGDVVLSTAVVATCAQSGRVRLAILALGADNTGARHRYSTPVARRRATLAPSCCAVLSGGAARGGFGGAVRIVAGNSSSDSAAAGSVFAGAGTCTGRGLGGCGCGDSAPVVAVAWPEGPAMQFSCRVAGCGRGSAYRLGQVRRTRLHVATRGQQLWRAASAHHRPSQVSRAWPRP